MKTTMTVTIGMEEGNVAYFKIEFNKSDFISVVASVEDLTIDNIYTNNLWIVI